LPPIVDEQVRFFAKDPDRRTPEEVKSLVPFMKQLQAFKDLEIDDGEMMRLIYNIGLNYYP